MLNQLKVTAMSYRQPRTTPFATVVQIRRAEEGSPGGFTVGGGAGTIEWVGPAGGGESETPHSGVLRAGVGGGRGGRDPSPRSRYKIYKIPLMGRICYGARCAVFAVKTHRSPLKRHSTSREGSSSLRCGRLAARLDDAFLLISPPHTQPRGLDKRLRKKSPPPAHCSST